MAVQGLIAQMARTAAEAAAALRAVPPLGPALRQPVTADFMVAVAPAAPRILLVTH